MRRSILWKSKLNYNCRNVFFIFQALKCFTAPGYELRLQLFTRTHRGMPEYFMASLWEQITVLIIRFICGELSREVVVDIRELKKYYLYALCGFLKRKEDQGRGNKRKRKEMLLSGNRSIFPKGRDDLIWIPYSPRKSTISKLNIFFDSGFDEKTSPDYRSR